MNMRLNKWLAIVYAFYFFLPFVLPNTMRDVSIPLFLLIGLISFYLGYKKIGAFPIGYFLFSVCVTLFYILIGYDRASDGSFLWLIFVYIVSPFIWICFFSFLFDRNIYLFLNFLAIYGLIACISVFVFFYLFLNFGPDSVRMFIDESNVDFSDGRVAATMHVYGSLIFVTTALISVSKPFLPKIVHGTLILLFGITAVFSGRSALQLAVIIGVFFHLIFSDIRVGVRGLILISAVSFLSLLIIPQLVQIFSNDMSFDIWILLNDLFDKIMSGGGEERVDQYWSLLTGSMDNYFMGAGHGVPALVIRNEVSPWKYELLWLSTLYSVGVFGFFVYALPFVLSIACFSQLGKLNLRNGVDVFMLSGMMSVAIASNTNPYMQSFDFQWMYVAPAVYFYKRLLYLRGLNG